MCKLRDVLSRIAICLLILFSCSMVGCDSTNNEAGEGVNLDVLFSYITINDGESVRLSTLYRCDGDGEVVITSSSSDVVYIKEGIAYARSEGLSTLTFLYTSDSVDVSKRISCKVVSSVTYASDVYVEDRELKLGQSVTLGELYTVVPSGCVSNVKIVCESDCVKRLGGSIKAIKEGIAKVNIIVSTSATETITKTITITVKPKVINLTLYAYLRDMNDGIVKYAIDGESYKIYINSFKDFNAKAVTFSNNIKTILSYSDGNREVYVVHILASGDINVTYDSVDDYGLTTINNNVPYYNSNDFRVDIVDNNNNVMEEVDGVYTFYIAEKYNNPYASGATIKAYLNDLLLTDCVTTVVENKDNAIIYRRGNITINKLGSATMSISNAYFTREIKIVVTKAYIEDCTIEYNNNVVLSQNNLITFQIVKDHDYNYLPDDIRLVCNTAGVEVRDNYTLRVTDNTVTHISGYMMIGELVKEYFIDCVLYNVDSVEVYYGGSVINDTLTISRNYATLTYYFYNGNRGVSVGSSYPMRAVIDNGLTTKEETLTKYLYLNNLTNGVYTVTIYCGAIEINKLTIVVE